MANPKASTACPAPVIRITQPASMKNIATMESHNTHRRRPR